MNEEFFDVVNEQDEVIGRLPRPEVHRQALRHRAVHVLLYNRQGDLFLQKRSMNKDNNPGVWDSSASGHVDSGETYDGCARREVVEELGLKRVPPLERLFRVEACEVTGWEFVWVYRGASEGPFELHPEEIDEGGWFGEERLRDWIRDRPADFSPAFLLIWERVRSECGPMHSQSINLDR